MRNECDTRRKQLGTGRLDEHVATAIDAMKRDSVIRARFFFIDDFSLSDGGLIVDVPDRRRVRLIRLATIEVA